MLEIGQILFGKLGKYVFQEVFAQATCRIEHDL